MFLPLLGSCPWPAKIISPAPEINKKNTGMPSTRHPTLKQRSQDPESEDFMIFMMGSQAVDVFKTHTGCNIIIKKGMPKSLLLWCVTKMHVPPTLKIWETGSEISSYCWWEKEILHQLIGSLSHHLQGFIHPRWVFTEFLPSTVSCHRLLTIPSSRHPNLLRLAVTSHGFHSCFRTRSHRFMPGLCLFQKKHYTLLGTNISHLWKRKIIFPATSKGDMLVPWKVTKKTQKKGKVHPFTSPRLRS